MKSDDLARFSEAFNNVYKMYKHTNAPEDVIKVYFDYLKRFEIMHVLAALHIAMQESPDYFPPAPLIEKQIRRNTIPNRMHESVSEITAMVEKGQCRIMAQGASFVSVDTSSLPKDSIRDEALRRCPAPIMLKDLPYWANRFRDVYEQIQDEQRAGRMLLAPAQKNAQIEGR